MTKRNGFKAGEQASAGAGSCRSHRWAAGGFSVLALPSAHARPLLWAPRILPGYLAIFLPPPKSLTRSFNYNIKLPGHQSQSRLPSF